MKTGADKLAKLKTLRERRLVAGACVRCGMARTDWPGYTSAECAACADKTRTRQRNKARTKRGIPLDAPVKPSRGGAKPRPEIPRSDEYRPELLDGVGPRRKATEIFYGSLTLDDIHRATSALPLKPPGK